MSIQLRVFAIFCLIGTLLQTATAQLSVTQPTGATVVAAGDDFATQVIGDPWDMSNQQDVVIVESYAVSSQAVSAGLYSGNTTANGANFYPLFMGYPSSINLSRGAYFPIDTARYRYLTLKIRATQPAGTMQFVRAVFLQNDSSSYGDNTLGYSAYFSLPANQWTIIRIDLDTQIDAASPHQWTAFPKVMGLRIDPATTNAGGAYASVHFDIDWIRLTASPVATQQTSAQWTDSGYSGTYNVFAIDNSGTGTGVLLGTVSGGSLQADTSILPPGQYQIQVARTAGGGTTANSPTFRINSPPQIALTAPSVRGEQAQSFAQTLVGNPWGPIEAADLTPLNFTAVSYTSPAGSFRGRPINSDPGWLFNLGGHQIDTNLYRSLCFSMEVFGVRDLGPTGGSVARLFWGPTASALTTSQDIVLDDNAGDTVVSEYCIPDLAAVPLEPAANGGTWSGTKGALRLDPDEFAPPGGCSSADVCHDVRLDSLVLSPFAHANPGYTLRWTSNDTDNAGASLQLALDPDTNPTNGNEVVIYNQSVANGNGSFAWPGSASIASGTYHVLATANDGVNLVFQYAGGVIIVTSDLIFRNGFQ